MSMNNALRDLRRQQIIAAARGLVSAGGLEALTISKLEEQVDFSRGVITYHFKGKDEIVMAVLHSALDEIVEGATHLAQKGVNIREKIHAILTGMIQGFIEKSEAAQIMVSFWSRIPKDPEVTEMNAKLYDSYRSQVARVLGKARKSREITANKAQIDAISALVVGIVIGVAMQVYFQPASVDPSMIIKESAEAISLRLGLRQKPKSRS
jgi:TetR/AcrR family transcriptional regulator, fatty acid metabolism regulator protein